ncbi:MAG: ABC transporter permease [Gammaproteobacteria bacterium]|jgi:lipopolysaccharide transport system permease protein|nr:ABC transporter permease [Gammaproteobacteria bacterium]MDP6615770.1 ABC transporter permease [Gammaproteobacteria bacterium]MDP6695544.1 ABC transporter permease [Gammaproteobacteria bacterium]
MSEQSYIDTNVTVIEPVAPWGFIDMRELARYRDLLYFMIWRSVKVAYAQSIGGIAWAIVQPAVQVLVFSLIFGGLLAVDTGGIPYPLLSTVAVIPWSYMSSAMSGASGSLVTNVHLLGKIYFPRAIFLITPIVGSLISFLVSSILIIAVLTYYGVGINMQMLYLPFVFLLMMLTPLSIALWMSSLAIRFRDVRIVMNYFMRLFIYLVPVMYPSEKIPPEFRDLYILNPFVGVIEGFRSCLLGHPMMWDSLLTSASVTIFLFITGGIYFRRMERVIVDVI